ncbi:MAG: hybrid sensor histidine kinase/response regulator, partial [Panacagrimonas sp.]
DGPPDPELLAIFAPEARELLEALHDSLNTWREVPANAAPARVMQRDLHTFKGGARMAGLRGLGDAAHALETRLVELERRNVEADSGDVQRVDGDLARLAQLVDEVLTAGAAASASAETTAAPASTDDPQTLVESEPIATTWDPQLFWRPGIEESAAPEARREAVRVPVERLDSLLNQTGEISIYRARMEESHAVVATSLAELAQTLTRVREQLRLMDIENEAQVAATRFASGEGVHRYESQFDPLEMDRYSRMSERSRSLNEGLSDLGSLHATLDTAVSEGESLLQQQGRIVAQVQQALMGALMVPFSGQVPRLTRVVRQTAEQNGRQARAEFTGVDSELDRNVLERMTAPLEHLLRNAVVHGIENSEARVAAGKSAEGLVRVDLRREGPRLLIEVSDDGRGLDYAAIRANAVKRGLIADDALVSDEDLVRFVFAAGFSTAAKLTQDAGRGIGMDVVAAEVKQLGGSVDVVSETGKGVRIRIRLPLTLAVSQALVVQLASELFAVPLAGVEGVVRIPRESLNDSMREGGTPLDYAGKQYPVRWLGELVDLPPPARIETRSVPAILMRLGEGLAGAGRSVALVAERLIGNREIVAKPAGPVLGSVPGISGATSLADGRVMLIIDVPALMQEQERRRLGAAPPTRAAAVQETRPLVMVVDDSITIRRVTERLLVRKGYRVLTAKDGMDAMALLQTEAPDAMLLDIEMPRADGFEVARFVRNSPRIARLPIVMITSRSSEKHRQHAQELGVDRYLTKPYQEDALLAALHELLEASAGQIA